MEQATLFADVLLPLPVGGRFTYRVPPGLQSSVQEGIRVVVQFGARKIYTALVVRLHGDPPASGSPKQVLSALDDEPVISPVQLQFWDWISDYYLCHPGEVMNAALPAAFKLASESRVALNPDGPSSPTGLNEKEELLLEALQRRRTIALTEVSRILELQKTIPVVRTLIDKGLVIMEEELEDPWRQRPEKYLRPADLYLADEEAMRSLFDRLEKRARKQLELLMTWVRLSGYGFGEIRETRRADLLKEARAAGAQADRLVSKGIFVAYEKKTSPEPVAASADPAGISLSPVQQQALDEIHTAFEKQEACLLHGVTSSGKTEIYIKLIRDTIDQGKQVLFLLPEIALTAQIINRLRKYFGDRVGVYHSRFSHGERASLWHAVLSAGKSGHGGGRRHDIILGARSALLLPFDNLGLVVVDEEHDPSFKQTDPAPRYQGRDAAVYLARLHGARILLGSATPSVESYYNALQGKYGLVSLTERFGDMQMPAVRVIDLRDAHRRGLMKSHFSSELLDRIRTALENREQVILFQNRRGFSLRLECDTCHWMPVCINCDVTLVYHKRNNQLRCHYCGHIARIPEKCPECQGAHVKMKGFGTEKVEEELALMFPGVSIARMDLDTTRSKQALQQIISDFESGRTSILVGTQMVTKGLDFDNVGLVGILSADNMLSYPDFRSAERSFQLMAQVAGRSGRKFRQGEVIIQAFNPEHAVIHDVVAHDYAAMFRRQVDERHRYHYPPFTRMVLLKLKHKDPEVLRVAADDLARSMRRVFGKRVLGPEHPMVTRIMNLYIKHILLKIEREAPLAEMKERLSGILEAFRTGTHRSVRVITDVDPQ